MKRIKQKLSKFTAMLLAVIMIVGMLPVTAFAAAVPVSGKVVYVTDVPVKAPSYGNMTAFTIQNITIEGATVVSAEETAANTLKVVLAGDTDPSVNLTVKFGVKTNNTTVSGTSTSVQLSGGVKSQTFTLIASVRQGSRPVTVATANYTIVFETEAVELVSVTPPTGEGIAFDSKTGAYVGREYSFTIAVDDAYDSRNMVVKVNDTTLENPVPENGVYTYTVVPEKGEMVITVEGVTAKEKWNVTLTDGSGYTIASSDTPYKGEDYTFTVTVDTDNYKIGAEGLAVLVNGEKDKVTDNGDGTYTIKALDGDKTVTVTGVVERENFVVNKPNVPGVTFNGADTVREGKDYTFTLAVDNAYKADNMVVTDKSGGTVTFANGTYTISNVTDAPEIVISGVVAKQRITVSLPTVNGLVIRGADQVFEGEDYSFTVSVKNGYSADNIVVTVNGNILTGNDGTYTISAVTAVPTISVTATVQKLPGDVTINKVTGNGSLNYIVFSDVNGKPIEGIETDLNGNEISVRLPKGFDLNGQIKAAFDLTDENNDGYPFVSTSDRTTGNNAYGSRFTEKYISLANGSATFVFYYYNNATGAVNDGGQTRYTIKLKVDNDLPVLANGVEPTASVTIAVGENYELNLSDIFTDADDTLLTYQYKVNDGNWTDCDASFSYTNELSGTYTLTFRAFDTKDYSEAVYTVTLTVEDSKENYEVQVTVPAGVEPTFYVSDETGVVGNVLEASNSLLSSKVYKVNVPSNVSYIAWRTSDGMGMHAAVSKDAELNLIKADFKATLVDQSVDTKAKFTVKYGELSALGKDNSFLLLDGITYTVSVTAGNSGYRNTERTEYRPVNGDNEIPLEQKYFTVIAPKDSVVSAGMLDGSYGYKFVEPISHETQGDTEVYKFRPMVGAGDDTRSTVPFIRVQRPNDPDAVTYWRWHDTWKDNFAVDGKTITVTEENLCMNDDGAHDADTVNRSFSPNDLDIGDIYMNINAQGYINLSKGGTKQLNMFRNWQAIEAYVNACVAQPDFHYEVIPLKGENVVSITPDTNNSGVATLKAENDGTALVLVTYDAMFSTKTATGSGASYGAANIFSAIWPERTGVFVVSVGKDGTAIKTNMTCNGKTFDAEHDPQFYTGTDGASVSFKPEDNCTVTVSRGYEDSGKWRFGAFDGTGITTDADGNVTVSGLTTGRHIIRVEKDGVYTYQVVTAQQVTVEIKDQDGNPVTEDTPVMAGTKITVTFKGLTHPAQKLAKIYNYNPFVWLTNDKGGGYGESTVGKIGSYGFNGTPQRVTLTVPADWDSDTMTLQGTIRLGGFHGSPYGIGGHRNLDYTGRDMGNGTEAKGDSLGTLPTITLKVQPKLVSATGVTLDQTSLAMRVTETKTLTAKVTPADSTEKMVWASSNTAVATVDETGVVKAVGVGETTITVTVGSVSATCAVTVSDPIPVTEITLSHAFAKLEPTKQLYLSATVNADATDKTVTWTSSDKTVAEVNESGVVTAVAVGTTVITAQAGNETAKCIITVEQKQDADNIATVYLSISHDAQFMMGRQSSKAMALQKLDVPYFDLSNYGLEAYEIPESDPDYGKVTALHLYIYATEVFYCGVSEDDAGKGYLKQKNILGSDVLTVSGGPGSALLKDFWGYDMNLNYYLNYRYPYYPGTDVGATCDRIVLSDDDIITVAHFTNMDFMSDPVSVFNYITLTMQEDTAVLQAYRAGADMGNGGSNTPVKAKLDVYYAKAGAMTSGNVTAWTKVGTTDENGQLQVNTLLLEPGDYVFAVAGRTGEMQTTKICSAPGGVVVKVLESADRNKVKDVVDLIKAIGTVTLESGDAITAARLAYETLAKPALQDAVSNYQTLLAAEAELKVLQEAKADQDAADAFAALVEDIGPVEATEACKAKIDAAKASYATLTETQMVLAAEAKATLDQAENAYANLVASEKDKAAAKAVQDLIAAIGTVTLDSETEIVAARDAYNALKEELKPLVENLDVLTTAENALAELKEEVKIDAVEQMIASIGVVTLESETAITDARKAYDALSDEQKEKVENADVLIEAEKVLAIFKMDKADSNKVYKDTGDYLEKQVTEHGLTVNSIGGDWIVLGLERAGRKTPNIKDYYNVVIKFVQEEINNNEQLHRAKSTENSRVILALTAAGYDVTNVTGHNLLMGLTDMEYVKEQGVNGPIWALIAFDSHNYEIPVNNKAVEQVTREKLIAYILEKQLDDGGWTLSGTKTDVDMTGMALAALAPYYSKNEQVKAAVDKALVCLSTMQNADGGFGSVAEKGSATAESAAQVIVALTALGIDPNTDSRFVKNGRSVVNALCDYAVEGGGFKHVSFLGLNGMATEQGYYALAAYFRFLDKKTSLYNMSDVTIKTAVTVVEDLIDAIGEVSYDAECKSRIDAARDAYDALSSADKAKVKNYKKLTAAEATYAQLEKDHKAAQRVIDLIDSIGYVSLNSENKILRARAAYNSLTYAQKKLVYNYSTLLYAEERLEELKIEQVEDLIDAIGTVTLDSKAKIERARSAYNALSNAAQKKVSNLNVLVAAEKAYDKLVKEAKEEEAAKRVNEVTSQIESISEDATVEELLDAILAFDILTEAEKAASGKVEAAEALKKQISEMIQTDVKTGISVSDVEWNIQLVVEKEQSAVQTGALQEKLGNNTLLGLWDIYLKDIVLNQEVQPDGTVLVKIPLTLLGDYSGFDGLAVVHYADDGTVEYLNSEIAEECVTFHAADFSYYAVVGYMGDSPLDGMMNDEANDTVVMPWIITGCCAVVLLGVVLFLNGKSKKQKVGKHAE